VVAATLYLDSILIKQETQRYHTISKFPSVERDLAFLMPKDMSVKVVVELMQQTLKNYLVDVYVFDVYQGEHIADNQKSVAFRMILNDVEKTLTNEDVDKWIKKVIHRCQFELKLEMR
jgi:phenylalanyl-tRNA synthetase beta chain